MKHGRKNHGKKCKKPLLQAKNGNLPFFCEEKVIGKHFFGHFLTGFTFPFSNTILLVVSDNWFKSKQPK
jgi:hypothetical protein